MQITLDQNEIHEALTDYVRQRISIKDNQSIEIDLKNGRGENGTSAVINIVSLSTKLVASVKDAYVVEEEDDEIPFDDMDEEETTDARPALFG